MFYIWEVSTSTFQEYTALYSLECGVWLHQAPSSYVQMYMRMWTRSHFTVCLRSIDLKKSVIHSISSHIKVVYLCCTFLSKTWDESDEILTRLCTYFLLARAKTPCVSTQWRRELTGCGVSRQSLQWPSAASATLRSGSGTGRMSIITGSNTALL